MKARFTVLCLLFFAANSILANIPSQSQPPDSPPRPAEIDDFFGLNYVGDAVISPDGMWVAYTVRTTDYDKQSSETRIWMRPLKGGEAIPMTAKGSSASRPQWSPDGKYLSFMASRGENSRTQVWVLDRRGGEAQQLTNVEQGINGYEWSPDGSRLLLMIRDKDQRDSQKGPFPYVIDRLQFKQDYVGYLDRRRVHIYTFVPGDTTVTQLTYGDFDHSQATWSPDGNRIAFVSNRTDEPDGNFNTDIWIVDANKGEKESGLIQVTTNPGSDHSPAWSPDGRNIAYITSVEPDKIWYATPHLAVVSADGNGLPRLLTQSLDRHISSPEFSVDGRTIYFLFEDAGESQLASIRTDGTRFTRVIRGQLTVNSFAIHGSTIAANIGRFNNPNELYTFSNGRLNRLTHENDNLLARLKLPTVEEIRFNSMDGTEIHGFLVKPIGYEQGKLYPLILWIHGGPVAQFDHSYNFNAQLFASNGYAVAMINPRGSSGYGQQFSEAIFADWGNKDFQDVMAGVDHVIEMGVADPDRLGVGGWSYGGILTNYVITKTDRFKGAISGSSETLLRSNYGHDHYQRHWEAELGLPWETPEKWERISAFNDVANVTTPTLWIGGAEDWNVPILGSEQMYQAMRRLGIETLLVVYPGEHHGISRPAFQRDRFERYLDWFKRFVNP